MPKTDCNVKDIEIDKFYRLTPTNIEPVGVRVPRARVKTISLILINVLLLTFILNSPSTSKMMYLSLLSIVSILLNQHLIGLMERISNYHVYHLNLMIWNYVSRIATFSFKKKNTKFISRSVHCPTTCFSSPIKGKV
jgi:hypothetical protein